MSEKERYIRVEPKRELTNPNQITRSIAGLCEIGTHMSGIESIFKSDSVPIFECLIYSQGKNEQIYFMFTVSDKSVLDTLENKFEAAYPDSFDVSIVEKKFDDMVLPKLEYSSIQDYKQQFGPRIENWDDTQLAEKRSRSEVDDPDSMEIRVAEDEELALPGNPVKVSEEGEDGVEEFLLAQPSVEDVDPIGIEWMAEAERQKDWMTTMKQFPELMAEQEGETAVRSPIAGLIQHMSEMKAPCAFQVLFRPKQSWSTAAQRRKNDLQLGRDTMWQKAKYEIGELIHGESGRERRKEKRKGPPTVEGEDASPDQTADVGTVGGRKKLIDDKHPQYTFTVNMRATAIPTRLVDREKLKSQMETLTHVFDDLGGKYYRFKPEIYENRKERILDESNNATKLLRNMKERTILTDTSGKTRRSIVLSAPELANFIVVPSSENLTVSGTRQTRAKPRTRNPLPRPDPDLMEQFHEPGMRVGYALDELGQPEDIPTQVPPSLLNTHYGRFATTGAGKSKAIQNDMLSLYENTDGPIILIDPKGDGMSENFLRCFWYKYKDEQERLEDAYFFPIPDVLPGFSFFDIRPDLARGERRVDAIQKKADGYEEILKLVMGREKYRESKVAPNIIQVLIKSLFDKKHGMKNGVQEGPDKRESPNYFSHRDLEKVARELRMAASEGDGGRIPKVDDKRLEETMTRHLASNESDFATIMDAVFNRIDYIKQDAHLRKIFDNTQQQLDFDDFLHEKSILLFDLGDLRDDASLVMTGLILTELWDTLNNAKNDERTEEDVVNVIIDEASSVAVSSLMNKMLEKGRGFGLSVGLSMQFPGQMRMKNEDVYRNVLNNMGTFLIGKIPMDEDIARAVSNEQMDAEEFENRFKSLPRGELIGKFPSPSFKETGPQPFSLDPLPIPPGHSDPDCDEPLSKHEEVKFQDAVLENILEHTKEQCGVEQEDEDSEDQSDEAERKAGAHHNSEPADSSKKDPDDVHSAARPGSSDDTSTSSGQTASEAGTASDAESASDTDSEDTDKPIGEDGPDTDSAVDQVDRVGSPSLDAETVDKGVPGVDGLDEIESRFDNETQIDMDGEDSNEGKNPLQQATERDEVDFSSMGSASDPETENHKSGDDGQSQSTSQEGTTPGEVSEDSETGKENTDSLPPTTSSEPAQADESSTGAKAIGGATADDGPKPLGDGRDGESTTDTNQSGTPLDSSEGTTSPSTNGESDNGSDQSNNTDDGFSFDDEAIIEEPQSETSASTTPDTTDYETFGSLDADAGHITDTIVLSLRDATAPNVQSSDEQEDDDGATERGSGQSKSNIVNGQSTESSETEEDGDVFFPDGPSDLGIGDSDSSSTGGGVNTETDGGSAKASTAESPDPVNSGDSPGRDSAENTAGSGDTSTDDDSETGGLEAGGNLSPLEKEVQPVTEQPDSETEGVDKEQEAQTTQAEPPGRDATSNHHSGNGEPTQPTGEYSGGERDNSQVPGISHSEDAQRHVRQSQQALATELPDSFTKSTVDPSVGYRNHGLSSQEAMFLRTVIDAYNGHNDYPLELPMSKHLIDADDGVNPEKLEKEGFIKRHYLLKKGHYYTPTPKAQRAVGRTLKSGERVGDIGEDMPHRFLAVLAKRYFESLPNVHVVKLYAPIGSGEDEGVIDVLAVDENHNPLHVAEIEAGERGEDGRWGTNNDASVAKDYKQMSSVGGQKWWFVRNRDVGKRMLNHLKNADLLPLNSISGGPLKRNRKQLAQIGEPVDGIDHIYTASELYKALENKEILTDE